MLYAVGREKIRNITSISTALATKSSVVVIALIAFKLVENAAKRRKKRTHNGIIMRGRWKKGTEKSTHTL